ncbi:MAG: putative Ig domain-containing protein, partial [Burkholderiales bacterium]|nr:putative Ig domain-containing protein [Burkholderiales bacterium]
MGRKQRTVAARAETYFIDDGDCYVCVQGIFDQQVFCFCGNTSPPPPPPKKTVINQKVRWVVALCFFGLSVFTSPSSAQAPSTFYYQTYLNLDGNPAIGCTVSVPDITNTPQTLLGVDVSLVVTVTNGILVSAERFACIGGALVSQGADFGHPTYTLGGAFIEYRIPNVAITPQTTVGFAASASPNFNPSDVFFESSPGQPISLAPLLRDRSGNVPIPVSTPILLFLIAIAAGLIAARTLRTPHGRRIGAVALIFCLVGISGAVYSAVQIILDGSGKSWTGASVLATAPESDALYPEINLLRAYGVYQGSTLYLKLDFKQKPGGGTPPVNTPPRITSDPVIMGTVGTSYSYQVEAEDNDGDTLTYSLTEAPTGMNIDSDGLITWASPALGTHNITVRVSDGQAQVEQNYTLTISDVLPPAIVVDVNMTEPAAGGTFTQSSSISLKASASITNGAISKLEFFSGSGLLGSGFLIYEGEYSYYWSATAGDYNVFARVTDHLGGTHDSQPVNIKVCGAPTAAFTSPSDGAQATVPGEWTLEVTASTALGCGEITQVSFYNGVQLLHTATNAPYIYLWQNVLVGNHTLTAIATDSLGGMSRDEIRVTVDDGGCALPKVKLSSPLLGERKHVSTWPFTTEFVLEAEVSGEEACAVVEKVGFYADDTLLYEEEASPYRYHWQDVSEGVYVLTVKATDSLGREISSNKAIVSVEMDEEPLIAFRSPGNSDLFKALARIPFEIEIDRAGITPHSVEIFATGDVFSIDGTLLNQMDLTSLFLMKDTFDKPRYWDDVFPGEYTFIAKVADPHGIQALSAPISVKVIFDPEAVPQLAFKQPLPEFVYQEPADIPVVMLVNGGWVRHIDYYGDGDVYIGRATEPPFSITWPQVMQEDSPDGRHTVVAKAETFSGEIVTVESEPFYVRRDVEDSSPVKIVSPEAGDVFFQREEIGPCDGFVVGDFTRWGFCGVLSKQIEIVIEVDMESISEVERVDFYGDGVFIGEAEFLYEWEGKLYYGLLWANVEEGSHTLLARVYASEENFYSRLVQIDFKEPFHIKITQPKNWTTYKAPFALEKPFFIEVETYPKNIEIHEEGVSLLYHVNDFSCMSMPPYEVNLNTYGGAMQAICVVARPKFPYPSGGELGIIHMNADNFPRRCLPQEEDAYWEAFQQTAMHCIGIILEPEFEPPEPEPALEIFWPVNGIETVLPVMVVRGWVREPEGARVRVNGFTVPLSETGYFSYETLRLSLGVNDITIELFSPKGNESKTIRVTRLPPEERDDKGFTFTMIPSEGIAPLTTVLEISSKQKAIALNRYCFNVQMRKGGTGSFSSVASIDTVSTKEQIRLTYPLQKEGFYEFRIEVRENREIDFGGGWVIPIGCVEVEHTAIRSVIVDSSEPPDICVSEVSLISPENGTTLTAPGELTLAASTKIEEGCSAVTRVEFYSGSWLLHTATAAPYTYTWKNIPSGSHTVYAKAYSPGADSASAVVQVIVESDEPVPEFHILTPTDGATINNAMATVTGIFTYTPGAVIIANGREARI